VEPEPRKKKKRGYSARLEGAALVLSHDAPLPAVCMKCGAHDDITRRDVVFSWTPAWVRFLVFCGVGLFLRLLMRARASLVIPLCARCNARWSAARSATIAAVVLLVGALVAARVLGVSTLARGLVLGAVAALVLVRLVFVRPRVLQVHHLDENAISFKGVNPEAAKEILEGARAVRS
jgi:ribosomal protein L40E